MTMEQREFDNIYTGLRSRLIALAVQFRKATGINADAEDIVQEALLKFWELSESGYPVRNPEAILVKITKNRCISILREQKRRPVRQSLDMDVDGGESSTTRTDKIDEAIIKARIYDCLTTAEREYMHMKTDEELSAYQISLRTGKPLSNIMTALSKAKRKLKDQLDKEESHGQ